MGARKGVAGVWENPGLVLRGGALALAVVMATLGALGLWAQGEPCLEGEFAGVGSVERATATGIPPSSSLVLRGSSTAYLFGTDITAAYAGGDFVVVCGSLEGEGVRAHSIRHAQDPSAGATPYLAGAVGLSVVLALDLAIPRVLPRVGGGQGGAGGLLERLRETRAERGAPRGRADNHSGAPANKD